MNYKINKIIQKNLLFFIVIIFISISNLFANYIATGSFGAATIDGKIYNQISFRPEITFKKLGLGLDINLYIDENGQVYSKNWLFNDAKSSSQTIMDKIYYVRWGNRNDNFYFRAGALPSVTLGYGSLVERYSNSMEYPQVKKLGLDLIYASDRIKFEYVHSDFKSTAGLIALNTTFNLSPRVNLFFTAAHDLNQLARLDEIPSNRSQEDWMDWCVELVDIGVDINCEDTFEDIENQAQYQGKNPVSGISIGVDYVITEKVSLYSEWTQLVGQTSNDENLGSGIVFPGIAYRFINGKFQLEGRHILSNNFIFNYWDKSYDIQRVVENNSELGYYTKESTLDGYKIMNGLYSYFTYDVLKIMNLLIGYQHLLRDSQTFKSFTSSINVNPNLIPKIDKIEFFYQNNNVSNPFKLGLGSIHGYDIGVEASDRMTITYQSRTTYRIDQSGELQPVRIMQLDTQFDF